MTARLREPAKAAANPTRQRHGDVEPERFFSTQAERAKSDVAGFFGLMRLRFVLFSVVNHVSKSQVDGRSSITGTARHQIGAGGGFVLSVSFRGGRLGI